MNRMKVLIHGAKYNSIHTQYSYPNNNNIWNLSLIATGLEEIQNTIYMTCATCGGLQIVVWNKNKLQYTIHSTVSHTHDSRTVVRVNKKNHRQRSVQTSQLFRIHEFEFKTKNHKITNLARDAVAVVLKRPVWKRCQPLLFCIHEEIV